MAAEACDPCKGDTEATRGFLAELRSTSRPFRPTTMRASYLPRFGNIEPRTREVRPRAQRCPIRYVPDAVHRCSRPRLRRGTDGYHHRTSDRNGVSRPAQY